MRSARQSVVAMPVNEPTPLSLRHPFARVMQVISSHIEVTP
jgi:hypothetical protein